MTFIIAGTLLGSAISANAAGSAASTQANAANQATATQQGEFNTIQSQNAPFLQSGYGSLGAILQGLGLSTPSSLASSIASNGPPPNSGDTWGWLNGQNSQGGAGWLQPGGGADPNQGSSQPAGASGVSPGYFSTPFNASDLNSQLAPNYQFMLNQGLGATNNLNNSTGGLISGNALQGADTFAENYAGNAYQNAFNNYNTSQSNIFNRLASIAGYGQAANSTLANSGTQLATGIAGTQQAAGAAQAAGTVGTANALSGGINNAAGGAYLSSLLNSGANGYTGGNSPYVGAGQDQLDLLGG